MLLVILGAGASYDSCPDQPLGSSDDARIPMSDGLFSVAYAQYASMWGQMDPILPFVRHRTDGRSVEEVLEDLQGEATHDPERLRQLMAVRYYIHLTISGLQAQ